MHRRCRDDPWGATRTLDEERVGGGVRVRLLTFSAGHRRDD